MDDISLELKNMKALYQAHQRWLHPDWCMNCGSWKEEDQSCDCILPKDETWRRKAS